MRELSGEQQTERKGYPHASAGPGPDLARGWLWHGFAALGISALGLAVAAAVGLTTEAETTRDLSAVPDTSTTVAAPDEEADKQSATKDPALAAFGSRETSGRRARPEARPCGLPLFKSRLPSETSCWRRRLTRSAEQPKWPAVTRGRRISRWRTAQVERRQPKSRPRTFGAQSPLEWRPQISGRPPRISRTRPRWIPPVRGGGPIARRHQWIRRRWRIRRRRRWFWRRG